jgi:hypothetical protein
MKTTRGLVSRPPPILSNVRGAIVLRIRILAFVLCLPFTAQGAEPPHNVVLVTLDGVRTQEMFGGLDIDVAREVERGKLVEQTDLYKRYWAPTPEQRRAKVMPFLWGTLMKDHGWIAGNPARDSHVQVTNRFHTSYPGYAEILTGIAQDDTIINNAKVRQPTPTVLEVVKQELRLPASAVAVFSSWDTFNLIAEHTPGTITLNAGFAPYASKDAELRTLDVAQSKMKAWDGSRFDYFTARFALDYLRHQHPRLLYTMLGDTDELAHEGRYELTLEALTHADDFLRELWTTLQAQPQYRDRTTLIILSDHGRGKTPTYWTEHNEDFEHAKDIWLAMVKPGDVRRGERANVTLYQNQIAATIAREFGLDYAQRQPHAGKPIVSGAE